MATLRANSLFRSLLGLSAAASLGLAGCGDDGGGGTGGPDPIEIDPTGTHNKYVVSDLTIPASGAESKSLGLDIDGDGDTENALGGLLGALASTAGLDLQTGIDEQLVEASFILLASVQATDIGNASGVGTYIFFGENPMPVACTDPQDLATCGKHLNGDGAFDVSATSPTDSVLAGTLAGGELSTNPGTVSIELPLGETAPLQIDLIGAQIQATVSATGITEGRIAGAITDDDVVNKLIPSVQLLVTGIIEDDCPGGSPGACNCVADSSGATVLGFFDGGYTVCNAFDPADPTVCIDSMIVGKDDCKIEQEELIQNSLVGATLLNPDLDLLDETGAYNPNSDGEVDSLSLGIGFSAVNGVFTLPAGI